MEKQIIVKDFSNLSLRIYTIGYPEQGESILCLLLDGDGILYSFVVDSFCSNNGTKHVVCEILESLGINEIDAFIWTHPDKDHSVGIKQILDRFDANRTAEIIISEGVYNSVNKLKAHAIKVYHYLEENYNTRQKYQLNKVSTTTDEKRSILSFKIKEAASFRDITCEFLFVAPLSAKIIRQEFNETNDYNAMSIMFALSLNRVNYLFCGDVEDSTLSHINKSIFKNTRFIKIPHHGSITSLKVIEYLKQNLIKDAVGVTTVFNSNSLPNPDVLRKYQQVCQCIYSTHCGIENFGCVQLDYDILCDSFSPTISGNAIQVFP